MGRPKKVRSRLITFAVRAKDTETGTWETWTIELQGNRIKEDKADWLKTAKSAGFRQITVTRVNAAQERASQRKQDRADIAREGLALLDKILASRK